MVVAIAAAVKIRRLIICNFHEPDTMPTLQE
jgi:hypothetical protein